LLFYRFLFSNKPNYSNILLFLYEIYVFVIYLNSCRKQTVNYSQAVFCRLQLFVLMRRPSLFEINILSTLYKLNILRRRVTVYVWVQRSVLVKFKSLYCVISILFDDILIGFLTSSLFWRWSTLYFDLGLLRIVFSWLHGYKLVMRRSQSINQSMQRTTRL